MDDPKLSAGKVDSDIERFAFALSGVLAAQFTRYHRLPLRVEETPGQSPHDASAQLGEVTDGLYPILVSSLQTLGIVGIVRQWVSERDIETLLPSRDQMH